jgi:hypothetical protein
MFLEDEKILSDGRVGGGYLQNIFQFGNPVAEVGPPIRLLSNFEGI